MVQYTAQSVHLMHDINALCKSGAGDSLLFRRRGW